MFKKLTFPILIFAIILQLLLPVGMIGYSIKTNNDVKKLGTEYKLAVQVSYAEDNTVYFHLKNDDGTNWYYWYWYAQYTHISVDEDGKAYISDYSEEKPENGDYIRTDENTYKLLESIKVDCGNPNYVYLNKEGYLLVKVYNGNVLPLELYIEDTSAGEWFSHYLEDTTVYEDGMVDFDDFPIFDFGDDIDDIDATAPDDQIQWEP